MDVVGRRRIGTNAAHHAGATDSSGFIPGPDKSIVSKQNPHHARAKAPASIYPGGMQPDTGYSE